MAEEDQIEEGCLVWLPGYAERLDRETYDISGLDDGVVNHPVLVLCLLGHDPVQYYLVASCTGTYHSKRGDMPISNRVTNSAFQSAEFDEHKLPANATQSLYLIGDTIQPKNTYLNVRDVYLVSDGMVRAQRNTNGVQDCKLDSRSLQVALINTINAIKTFKARTQIKIFLQKYPLPQEITTLTDPPPELILVSPTIVRNLPLQNKALLTKTDLLPESKTVGKVLSGEDAGLQDAPPSAAATLKSEKEVNLHNDLIRPGSMIISPLNGINLEDYGAPASLKSVIKFLGIIIHEVGENKCDGQVFIFTIGFAQGNCKKDFERLTPSERSDYLPIGYSLFEPTRDCGPRLHTMDELMWQWNEGQGYVMIRSAQWLDVLALPHIKKTTPVRHRQLTEKSLNVLKSKWIDYCSKMTLAAKTTISRTNSSDGDKTETRNETSGFNHGITQEEQRKVDTRPEIANNTSETKSTDQKKEPSEKGHKDVLQSSNEKVLQVVKDGKCDII